MAEVEAGTPAELTALPELPQLPELAALPETIPVREAHRFPTGPLEDFLVAQGLGRLADLRQMRGGQSNPTFLVAAGDGAEYVLRKQPPGRLLPSAHAVDREFRVLSALAGTEVPVPRPVAYCAEPAVIGTPFYLMERLRGRVFWDPALPELPRAERAGIYDAMNAALASLHRADWRRLGLADYGRPGNYFGRQIERWSRQWAASKTRENPAIDRLAAWLPAHLPEGDDTGDETTICHGDFRLDNMIFHATEPRVIGILDWELATLGHPLADLGYNCIPYNTAPDAYRGLLGRDLADLGIPSEAAYVARYCARTGRADGITPFHIAFALFRLAVILEGVLARARAGNASSADAEAKGSLGLLLAERGWALVR